MLRYLSPQLRRTYGAVVRTLMPWRVIDALSNLDDAEKRRGEAGEDTGTDTSPDIASTHEDGPDPGPPSRKA